MNQLDLFAEVETQDEGIPAPSFSFHQSVIARGTYELAGNEGTEQVPYEAPGIVQFAVHDKPGFYVVSHKPSVLPEPLRPNQPAIWKLMVHHFLDMTPT